MEQEVLGWLLSDNGFAIHAAVLGSLLLGGMGFPIPEDLPILLSGVAASKGVVDTKTIFLTCYLGVMIGDSSMYFIGYFFGKRLLTMGEKSRFFPGLSEERTERLREGLRKRRLFYIFVGRHLFPIRTATFISAGALHIPFLEFFFADGLAALVSVSLVMGLGYYLGEKITPELADQIIHDAHYYVIGFVAIACVIWLCRHYYQKRKATATAESSSEELPTEH